MKRNRDMNIRSLAGVAIGAVIGCAVVYTIKAVVAHRQMVAGHQMEAIYAPFLRDATNATQDANAAAKNAIEANATDAAMVQCDVAGRGADAARDKVYALQKGVSGSDFIDTPVMRAWFEKLHIFEDAYDKNRMSLSELHWANTIKGLPPLVQTFASFIKTHEDYSRSEETRL